MPGIIKIAVEGAKLIRQLTEEEIASSGMNIRYEYSPESFTGTEIDFAIEICESVMETLGATKENPIILNLPSTVEMSTPNTYADQIEYFCTKMKTGKLLLSAFIRIMTAGQVLLRLNLPCWAEQTASKEHCLATASALAILIL